MIVGFIIWSMTCIVLIGIGVWSFRSEKPVSFWAGAEAPKVKDVKKYNHAVGILWFVYAALFELLGIPMLFLKQNSAGFVPVILGTVFVTIAFMVAYVCIEKKYKV